MARKSLGSSVVVCDDAVSGSESDRDVADELRLSMEGLPTAQTLPVAHSLLFFLQLLTSESPMLRASMTLN